MPGKSRASTLRSRASSRKSAAQNRSRRATRPATEESDSDSQNNSDQEDEGEKTPTGRKAAVRASSAVQDMQATPATPTKQSRELLAGLDLSGTQSNGDDGSTEHMEDAISKKVSELTAKGWRPEEELDGVGGEDEDDDAYAGVDLISNSDEDDAAIRKREVMSFRQPEMSLDEQGDLARRLSLSDAGSDLMEWNGFDDFEGNPTNGSMPSNGAISRFLDYDESRPASFLLADDDNAFPREPRFSDGHRKVRFQDELDSDDSSDDDDLAEAFPDIFMETHQFTPSFQRVNDGDIFLEEGSDAGSVWDFDGEELAVEGDEEDEDEDDSWSDSDGSSGDDDSDGGETTDEEEPCPPPKRTSLKIEATESPAFARDSTPKASQPTVTETPISKRTKQKFKARRNNHDANGPRLPKAGTFDMDPRRNVLLVDGAGATQRNTLYPARIQTADERRYWQKMHQVYKNRTATPRTSVQISPADHSDDLEDGSPFLDTASPFDAVGSLLSSEVVGPPEAFLPFTSVDVSGIVTEDTSMASASEDEDDEMDILSPFVNFDGADSDEEDDSADTSDFFDPVTRTRSNTFPSMSSPSATPVQTPSTVRRDTLGSPFGGDLFSHLSRSKGLVHSFRMNQHYAKHMASYAADPTVRYSTSEMNAMQTGRRKAANTPITPMRKKRGGSMSKIGKVDWSKGLGVEKMGPPATNGHFKRPGSSGNGVMNGKKGPVKGLFR